MKKLLYLLAFLLLGLTPAKAQRLEIDSVFGVSFTPSLSNLHYGDSLRLQYVIHNRDTVPFGGKIYTNVRIGADSAVSSDSAVGGSGLFSGSFDTDTIGTIIILNTRQNLSGNQIVVVWPTGTGLTSVPVHTQTITLTSLHDDAPRTANALVAFPNPASDRLWLMPARPDARISAIALLDLLGRPQPAPFDGRSLDLRGISAGNYVLLVSFGDGTMGRYLVQRR